MNHNNTKNHDKTAFSQKSFRLLWLWLMRQVNPEFRWTDYVRATGTNKSIASLNINHDLPVLDALITEHFPDLKKVLTLLFRPGLLNDLPVLETKAGDKAHMVINVTLDYKTGTMTWEPFQQVFCDQGEEVGRVKISGGSTTFTRP